MGHSYVQLHTHIVFSTKHRQPFLDAELKPRLFAYMGGIIRELEGVAHLINGPSDHVHMLVSLPAKRSLSDIMRVVKTNSSLWVHDHYPSHQRFAWQTGYGAFSVSHYGLDNVRRYIERQEEHHRRRTFQEEYLFFLAEYGIEYDHRYVWD